MEPSRTHDTMPVLYIAQYWHRVYTQNQKGGGIPRLTVLLSALQCLDSLFDLLQLIAKILLIRDRKTSY